jgi:hypothetical protein
MKKVFIDIAIVAASIVFAVYIVESGAVHAMLAATGDGILLASFVAGLCFTSFFTTAPAIAVLAELSQEGNIFLIALVGALGAMLLDFVMFSFVRDRVAQDASELVRGRRWRGVRRMFKSRLMRRVLPILGALIIASPFPDEIGLTLMGAAKLTTPRFLLISYGMNFLGILLIGLAAQAF